MNRKGSALKNSNHPPVSGLSREWQEGLAAFMEASTDAFVLFDENSQLHVPLSQTIIHHSIAPTSGQVVSGWPTGLAEVVIATGGCYSFAHG